jgi:hypothetical protein
MAVRKFIKLASGRLQEEAGTAASVGAADEGKLVALDANGLIDPSMMPVGIGADTAIVEASEALASGDFVNIWDDTGTMKVRKADATVAGKEADGFVLAAVLSGANANVYFEGKNNALTGLTLGARYYLSAAVPGGATATPPTGTGKVVQYLGRAINATTIAYEGTDGVILA